MTPLYLDGNGGAIGRDEKVVGSGVHGSANPLKAEQLAD